MQCESSIRSELLDLLPVTGHRFGLKHSALDHLIWLIRHTRVMDWEPGNRAVVYKAVSDTAAERQVTARQIYNYEQAIAEAFGLRVELAYNRRRYGQRDQETGRIVTAFGFELTELRRALPVLRQAKAEIDAENERRRTLKRELAMVRGQVRKLADALIAYGDTAHIDTARRIAESIKGRVNEGTSILELEERIIAADHSRRDLQALLLRGKTCGSDVKISDTSEKNFRPIDPTLDLQTDYKSGCSPDGDITAGKPTRAARVEARPGGLSGKSAARTPRKPDQDFAGPAYVPPEETGARRISARMAVKAASPRFLANFPLDPRQPTPEDVVDAAKELLPDLGISRAAWRYACQIVGPYPAALCVLVTDRATTERSISRPGGYFRSMAKRALSGELALDRSIFGFLIG
jgi:replication initiation protein RepC